MSQQKYYPSPSKLILFLLASDMDWLEKAKIYLIEKFGPIEKESEAFLYKATQYYSDEMGERVLRQFLSFEKLVLSEQLADFKNQTNAIEEILSEKKCRQVNLDCGLLNLDKIVIASTKPASYRIYLRDGIYAQATYWYEKGSFHPWPWTYEEYRSSDIIRFFNSVRNKYSKQLNELKQKSI